MTSIQKNETETNVAVWNEKVITADLVIDRLKGKSTTRELHIGLKTILTPSAQDLLRAKGLNWKRVAESATRATALASQTWKIILQQVTPQLKTVLEELQKPGSIVWMREIAGTLEEGVGMAVTPLSRAEVTGVMLMTDRPHAAACLANRHAALRAAVVKELSDVESLRSQLGPNMYCLSPQGWGGFALRKVIMACVEHGPPTTPRGWKSS
ncbi:MAG: hypothetical protein ACKVT0_02970 [Planctomycetaceae bacterium]